MHSRTTGLSDYLAVDELDALRIARQIVRHLRWRSWVPGPSQPADEPVYDPAGAARVRLSRRSCALRDP